MEEMRTRFYSLWLELQHSWGMFLKLNEINCNLSIWIGILSGMAGLWLHSIPIIVLAAVCIYYGIMGYEKR